MSEETKLKDVIREEMDIVTDLLLDNGGKHLVDIVTRWLKSLQRIDKVCKERNRY